MHLFLIIGVWFHHSISCIYLLLWWNLHYQITSVNLHSRSTLFWLISAILVFCIHLLCWVRTHWDYFYSKEFLEFCFVLGGGISIALIFYGSCFTPFLDIIWPNNGTHIHLKWFLSLFNLRFTCLHTYRTLCSDSSWSLPFLS